MKGWSIFWYEWKHFVRSPFKVIALILFVVASCYGLHKGANLYKTQTEEIATIEEKIAESRQEGLGYLEAGQPGPEGRPWVNITEPFWAMWYTETHHFKSPSPALVYSVGQAEQYGFYKKVFIWASPYDSDMAQEIANPERLQTGTLDFSFSLLYLLPLVLLVFLYNLKSFETEQGFLSLIEVQASATTRWTLSRVTFYAGLLWLVVVLLLLYGALLTPVFSNATTAFTEVLLYATLYLGFWTVIYFFILRWGAGILGNALKMIGVWLLFAFIIPAAVHQWVSIQQPADFMLELIDAQREKVYALYDLPDSAKHAKVDALFPEIATSPIVKDSAKRIEAYNESLPAVANVDRKQSIEPIEARSAAKNALIQATYFFNPVTFFQNQFNRITQTHFDDYQHYRAAIQSRVDLQINTLVSDTWQGVKVDVERFNEYQRLQPASQ